MADTVLGDRLRSRRRRARRPCLSVSTRASEGASLADFGLRPAGNFAPLNRAASVFEAVAMKPETRRRLLPAWASALRIARRTAPLQAARRAP